MSRLKRRITNALFALAAVIGVLVTGLSPAGAAGLALPAAATGVAAAPLCSNCASDLIVVRTADGRVFYTVGADYYQGFISDVSGWVEVPGGARTPFTPAVAQWGNTVTVAITGVDNRVYMQHFSPSLVWGGVWQEVPGGALLTEGPTLIGGASNALTVLGPGVDHQIYYREYHTSGGWLQSGWRVIPGGFKTPSAIGGAALDGSIAVIAARGYDNRIYWAMSPKVVKDGDWGAGTGGFLDFSTLPAEIPGGGVTYHAPTVSARYDHVDVLVRATQGGIAYQMLKRDVSWKPGWDWVPGGGLTTQAPGASGSGRSFYYAYIVGGDNKSIWTEGLYSNGQGGTPPNALISMIPHGWAFVPQSTPPPPTPVPGPLPDLVWVSDPSYNYQTKTFTMNIKNAGTANAGAFRLSLFVNNTNVDDFVYTGLAAGQSATITYDMSVLQAGYYTYDFSIDSYNTVIESNENNNARYGPFQV